jgi:hypothetical protein
MLFNSLKSTRRMLWISTLLVAPSVFGVDGVTLIDQNAAMNGNVTPGDAPGFPVTLSRSGSYRLSGNLTSSEPNVDFIQIAADNVRLDLGGFSIVGPNVCTTSPTRCTYSGPGHGVQTIKLSGGSQPANVRVMNGTVQGVSGYGVVVFGAGNVVERVHAVMNGGTAIYTNRGAVIDCVVDRNGGGGFPVIAASVRNTVVTNNATGGITTADGLIQGNVVMNNDGPGIRAYASTVTGNIVSANLGFGIEAVCPGVVKDNTATRNRSADIATNGACTMADNSR